MQIIIPMSGFGERFRKAGYTMPKPLIEIEGKTIIEHVVDMFPGEQDFLFICNQDHLDEPGYHMREILQSCCPTGRIVGIEAHKLGPIHAVRQVEQLIDDEQPVVVNYCDFTCYWDWHHFKDFVRQTRCAGALPAYKGFHPHTLGTTNYAYMKESKGWVTDIQEKQPYTDNRMEEYASSGTYYFASGRLMKNAFRATMELERQVNGEYYVSLAYKSLFEHGQPTAVYPLQHFMQWGTPQDVDEYKAWSATFRDLLQPESIPKSSGAVVVPMAGLGQRFAREGYALTKPLIPVSGQPMVLQAAHDLPRATNTVFVLRQDMPGMADVSRAIETAFPAGRLAVVSSVTEGQACTALIGLDALPATASDEPVTIGACDNGVIYDAQAWGRLMNDPAVDVIVWSARGHPNAVRHPGMFGWIDADEQGNIRGVSVKKPLADPAQDPIVLGTFTFKRAKDYRAAVEHLMARNGRINGEFYIDSCINDAIETGLKCHLFEVQHALFWGTPNDLKTFEYWQSCFHKWPGHPYRLEHDMRVPAAAVPALASRYAPSEPPLPGRLQS